MRLGFAVRVVGDPTLSPHDSRREGASFSRSLLALHDIFVYLARQQIQFYRLSAHLLPTRDLATGLALIQQHRGELAHLGAIAQEQQLRLTLHLALQLAPATADHQHAATSLAEIELAAALLAALGCGNDGTLVLHAGGSPRDPHALARLAERYAALSPGARARVAIENDTRYSVGALLHLHQQCGVPLVFDYLHWQLHNPERLPLALALGLALATWHPDTRPKVHLSSQRTEAHLRAARKGQPARVVPPQLGQHADFIAPADCEQLLRASVGLPVYDLMLEAKAGDLAVLRCRESIARLPPSLTAR